MAGGVLRGAGKQLVGALINLVGHYFIGFPIGVSLMFAVKMGIVGKRRLWRGVPQGRSRALKPSAGPPPPGLWTGMTICVLLQSTFFIIFLSRLDWSKASTEVAAHLPLPSLVLG